MVTIVKHEWHQHDRQYAIELDADLLSEIYPDLDEDEIAEKLQELESGELDFEEVIDDAYNNDVDIEWEFQYDDCWTDRKGGYDVTYELGDESSWVEPEKEPEPTRKCTKCRWTGQRYDTLTQHLREDGSVIEDYHNSEEESHHTKDGCPMCDSDVENINSTHFCTACDWHGQSLDTDTVYHFGDEDDDKRPEGDYCPKCGGAVEKRSA